MGNVHSQIVAMILNYGGIAREVRFQGDTVAKLSFDWFSGGRFYYVRTFPIPLSADAVAGFSFSVCFFSHVFQAVFRVGGGLHTCRASLRRFCAVSVRSTSSRAPLSPRSRSRSSLNIRFMCAKASSTFLRSSQERLKAGVSAARRLGLRPKRVITRSTSRFHLIAFLPSLTYCSAVPRWL